MDKFEQRWRALVRLKDSLGRGGAALIARAIGKEPNYISRALYPPGKEGRKRIGEDTAELLEAKFPGWMSDDGYSAAGASSEFAATSNASSPKGWDKLRDDQRLAIEQLIDVMLTRDAALPNTRPPRNGLDGED